MYQGLLRDEHGDVWMGFSRDEVLGHLADAGLVRPRFRVVSRVETPGRGPGTPLELFVASAHAPDEAAPAAPKGRRPAAARRAAR